MSFKINNKIEDKILLQLVPHGIDDTIFKPIGATDPKLIEFKKKINQGREQNFIILYNSRNIQRKRTSNIILSYRQFCDNLTPEQAAKCLLILHTELALDAGTNLLAVKEALCPNYNILFSPGKMSAEDLNLLYNCADITVCASSSEGFGLSTAESIMAGTPIIATVTGGLQDQMGFTDDFGNVYSFNGDWGTNSDGKYKKHGRWAYPVFPATRMVQGSIPTPYIYDEIATWEDFSVGFMYWYMTDHKTRELYGKEGRHWALNDGGINAKNMGKQFINAMDFIFTNWVKPKAFGVYSVKDYVGNTLTRGKCGFEIPKIDTSKIVDKISAIKT